MHVQFVVNVLMSLNVVLPTDNDSDNVDPFVYMAILVCICLCVCVCVLYRDVVREVVRLLLALNARSHAVSLARQTNVSLAD